MTLMTLLAWSGVAALTVMMPGADTILVLRSTMMRGRAAGFACVTGIALGCIAWEVASIAGLTALLAASPVAYQIVRLAGAGYLLWLGGSALWKSFRSRREVMEPDGAALRPISAFRAGLMTNMLNPKVGVFYISVLPHFLPADRDARTWTVVLVLIHLAVTLIWMPALVLMAARARRVLQRARVRAWLDRVTAGLLVGIGITLAAESG